MQTKIMYVQLFFLLHYSALLFSQVAANKINNEPDQKIQNRNIYLKDSLLLSEINDKPIRDTSKYINDFFGSSSFCVEKRKRANFAKCN